MTFLKLIQIIDTNWILLYILKYKPVFFLKNYSKIPLFEILIMDYRRRNNTKKMQTDLYMGRLTRVYGISNRYKTDTKSYNKRSCEIVPIRDLVVPGKWTSINIKPWWCICTYMDSAFWDEAHHHGCWRWASWGLQSWRCWILYQSLPQHQYLVHQWFWHWASALDWSCCA